MPLSKLKVKSQKLKVQVKSEKVVAKPAKEKTIKRVTSGLIVPIYSLAGRASGTLSLPKEIFGAKVNEKLLAQAMRVYMTNQKKLFGSTKKRGEVVGSTAKIYRQKGTGRARHGAVTAPIFVGGGIAFGPKPRKVRLDLPQKMKKTALISALSAKVKDQAVMGISGLQKASGKTKEIAQLLKQLNSKFKILASWSEQNSKLRSALIVTGEKTDNMVRAVRNIPGVNTLPANLINVFEVLNHNLLLITKEATQKLIKPQNKGVKWLF